MTTRASGSVLNLTNPTITDIKIVGPNSYIDNTVIGSTVPNSGTFSSNNITGAAGTVRGTVMSTIVYSANLARWSVCANSDAETGSNTGSNFILSRYNDAGVFIDNPLTINRATGIVNFSNPPTVAGGPYLQTITLVFPPQTTYYVDFNAGSDLTGDGLTSSTPWRSLQHAINTVSSRYVYSGLITIQCANGTYTCAPEEMACEIGPSQIAEWKITGNPTNPSYCYIDASAVGARGFSSTHGFVLIDGFQVKVYYEAYVANTGSLVIVSNCNAIGTQPLQSAAFVAYANGQLCLQGVDGGTVLSTLTMSGSFLCGILASEAGFVQVGWNDVSVASPVNFVLSSPSFTTAFAQAQSNGFIAFQPGMVSFYGAATGPKFFVSSNGVVGTNGQSTGYLPGSVTPVGPWSTGGQYV